MIVTDSFIEFEDFFGNRVTLPRPFKKTPVIEKYVTNEICATALKSGIGVVIPPPNKDQIIYVVYCDINKVIYQVVEAKDTLTKIPFFQLN